MAIERLLDQEPQQLAGSSGTAEYLALEHSFQLLSNGVLTGRGVVRYAPEAITGLRVAYAPVEDLMFGFALVLFTLSLWVAGGRRRRSARP